MYILKRINIYLCIYIKEYLFFYGFMYIHTLFDFFKDLEVFFTLLLGLFHPKKPPFLNRF